MHSPGQRYGRPTPSAAGVACTVEGARHDLVGDVASAEATSSSVIQYQGALRWGSGPRTRARLAGAVLEPRGVLGGEEAVPPLVDGLASTWKRSAAVSIVQTMSQQVEQAPHHPRAPAAGTQIIDSCDYWFPGDLAIKKANSVV